MSKQLVYGQVYLETDDNQYYLYLGKEDGFKIITDQAVIDSALNELAQVQSELGNKVDVVEGKGLSTNDFTNLDKAIVVGVDDKISAESITREGVDAVLQTQIDEKANSEDITSSLQITYDQLDTGKSTYTNSLLADKQVLLYSNQSTGFTQLTFSAQGVLNLGFTATSGFVGFIFGSLGTAPNADAFIQFLRDNLAQTGNGNINFVDSLKNIIAIIGSTGVTSPRFNLGFGIKITEDPNSMLSITDGNKFVGFRVSNESKVQAVDGGGGNDSTSPLAGVLTFIQQDSFGVFPRASGGITQQNIWHTIFKNNTGVNYSYIDAIGGTCISVKNGVQYGLLDSRIDSLAGTYEPSQIRLGIGALMTNDFGGQNIQLGVYGSTDQTTFYGALPAWYTKMLTKYQNMKFVHVINPVRNRLWLEFPPTGDPTKIGYPAYNTNTGFFYDQFAEAVHKVAPQFGVFVIDMRELSIITHQNMGTLVNGVWVPGTTEDGLHMLADAHKDYAIQMQNHTEPLFKKILQ